jgi:hypothetical protein
MLEIMLTDILYYTQNGGKEIFGVKYPLVLDFFEQKTDPVFKTFADFNIGIDTEQ